MNAPVALLASDWRNTIKSLREQFPDADDEALFDTCDGLTEAADVVALFVRQSREAAAMAAAVRSLVQDYIFRCGLLEGRSERLKSAALRLMEDMGEKTLRRPEFTLSVSNRPGKLEVYDEEAIPDSFFDYETKVVRTLNKDRLAAAPELPPGARMTNGQSVLSVRMK